MLGVNSRAPIGLPGGVHSTPTPRVYFGEPHEGIILGLHCPGHNLWGRDGPKSRCIAALPEGSQT